MCFDIVNDEMKQRAGMPIAIIVHLRVSSIFDNCNEDDDICENANYEIRIEKGNDDTQTYDQQFS